MKPPEDILLSMGEAATLLNVSQSFFCDLLDQNELPTQQESSQHGSERRVLQSDVVDFKGRHEAARLAVLDELQAQAQELDMGY